MTIFKKIIVCIFLLLLVLPLATSFFKPMPGASLTGELQPLVRPALTFKNWLNGSLQNYVEQILDRKLGLRGYFVRTDNQLNYWLFGEIHQKTKERLVIGKDHYLFEQNYINSYLGRDRVVPDSLVKRVGEMKVLQDKLKSQNKASLFVIAPSKASFFSEKISNSQLTGVKSEDLSYNYFIVVKELKKQGVNFWDGRQYFLENKKSAQAPLFAKSGTHWTDYGSCLATREIIGQLGVQLKTVYNVPECNSFQWSNEPKGQDADLVNLTNLWFKDVFKERLAYPNKTVVSSVNNLNLLLIGDSFSWNLLKHLKSGPFLENYHFAYYFNTDNIYPGNKVLDIEKSELNISEFIKNQDVIVIETNEAGLSDIGWGFVQEANKLK